MLLNPLNEQSRYGQTKFTAIDIESNDWTKYALGAIYDGSETRFFDAQAELFNFCLDRRFRNWTHYAHHGGSFDFLFLLRYLTDRGLSYTPLLIGGLVAQVRVSLGKNVITFRDSSRHYSGSLSSFAKAFSKTQKLSGAIDFSRESFDKSNPNHIEYLRHDILSLYESVHGYIKFGGFERTGLRATLASQSMDQFRRFMDYPVIGTPQDVQNFCREGYFGGRCELFKLNSPSLNIYDINSMYPYCMMTYDMPLELQGPARSYKDFGFHRVRVTVPDCYIPPLACKIDKKLYFPTGTFEGVYFSEELLRAERLGCDVEFIEGYEFTRVKGFFKKYIDYYWNLRTSYPKGSPQNEIGKLYLNALYGKFGQREEVVSVIQASKVKGNFDFFISEEVSAYTGLVTQTKFKRRPFMLVHISAAITAYSRMHLHNFMIQAPHMVYYCDTDSIFSNYLYRTGSALGELKLETEKARFAGRGAKYYMIETQGKITKKIKGVPRKYLESLSESDFLEGKIDYKEEKINKLRTSLIRSGDFLSKSIHKKSIKSDYTKRKITRDGETRPWRVINGKLK